MLDYSRYERVCKVRIIGIYERRVYKERTATCASAFVRMQPVRFEAVVDLDLLVRMIGWRACRSGKSSASLQGGSIRLYAIGADKHDVDEFIE